MTTGCEPRSAGEPTADGVEHRTPSSISALEKHACPACGAQAEWNPAKQKLVCPFCGTESPYEIDATTGKVDEIDLVSALRELPDERARLADGAPQRAVPELQGGDGVRRRRASARTASSAARRRSSPTTRSRRRSARRACCRSRSIATACATTCAAGDASKWLAPRQAGEAGARRHACTSLYIPYWTFDAQVHCPWDAEAGYYYYVNVDVPRQQGPHPVVRQEQRVRWEAGVRRRRSRSSTTSRCRARRASDSSC